MIILLRSIQMLDFYCRMSASSCGSILNDPEQSGGCSDHDIILHSGCILRLGSDIFLPEDVYLTLPFPVNAVCFAGQFQRAER